MASRRTEQTPGHNKMPRQNVAGPMLSKCFGAIWINHGYSHEGHTLILQVLTTARRRSPTLAKIAFILHSALVIRDWIKYFTLSFLKLRIDDKIYDTYISEMSARAPGAMGIGMVIRSSPEVNTSRLRQNGRHFPNAFSWMKMCKLRFHWSLFPRVQLTIFQHWFR